MNKKGIAPLLFLAIAGVVIIFGLIIAAFFSSAVKYVLIGILILVGFVFILGKAVQSDNGFTKPKIIVLLIFLGVGLFFILGSSILQETLSSGSYINVPTFGYYECAAASQTVESPYNNIAKSGSGFVSCPENTDGCTVVVRIPTKSYLNEVFNDYRTVTQICNINNGVCQQQNYNLIKTWNKGNTYITSPPITLLKSQKIWIDYQKQTAIFGWNNVEGAQYNFQYKPFIIWRNDIFTSGRKELTTIEQGCNFPSSIGNDKFFSSTTLDIVTPSQSSSSTTRLEPYKTRTFVTNFIPVSVENYKFVTYQNQQAYCTNGNIYQIDTLTTTSGTYKVVNIGVNPLLADLECCPGDTQPGYTCQEYKWKRTQVDSQGNTNLECSAFKTCPNAEWEISGNKVLERFRCENNKCVQQTQNVECTSNTHCTDGKTCDTKTYTCVNVPGGTIIDDKVENPITCEEKASSQPFLGWTWVESSSSSCGLNPLCLFGITDPKVTTTGQCKASFLIYYIIGGVILILGIASIFLIKSSPKKRRR